MFSSFWADVFVRLSICLSICMSACLLATLRKKHIKKLSWSFQDRREMAQEQIWTELGMYLITTWMQFLLFLDVFWEGYSCLLAASRIQRYEPAYKLGRMGNILSLLWYIYIYIYIYDNGIYTKIYYYLRISVFILFSRLQYLKVEYFALPFPIVVTLNLPN